MVHSVKTLVLPRVPTVIYHHWDLFTGMMMIYQCVLGTVNNRREKK